MNKEFLKDTIKANQYIYKALSSGIKNEWQIEYSLGAGGDISSGLDLFAESIFIKYLSKYGKIDSEEAGLIGEGDSSIIIDPLDGSSNANSNFPYFGSSVALVTNEGLLDVAVVCNFANGDIFYKLNDSKLMVGKLDDLEFKEERVALNCKVGIFERSYDYTPIGAALTKAKLKYRAPGAVALSLAYAHRVNFVLFIGPIRIYDFAAGLALCEGLKVSISEDYAIVTHSKDILNKLENILKEERE